MNISINHYKSRIIYLRNLYSKRNLGKLHCTAFTEIGLDEAMEFLKASSSDIRFECSLKYSIAAFIEITLALLHCPGNSALVADVI